MIGEWLREGVSLVHYFVFKTTICCQCLSIPYSSCSLCSWVSHFRILKQRNLLPTIYRRFPIEYMYTYLICDFSEYCLVSVSSGNNVKRLNHFQKHLKHFLNLTWKNNQQQRTQAIGQGPQRRGWWFMTGSTSTSTSTSITMTTTIMITTATTWWPSCCLRIRRSRDRSLFALPSQT